MDVATARAILVQAVKDEFYEEPLPEDDQKAVERAEELIEMAQQAWDQMARGEQIEGLLRMADPEFAGEVKQEKAPPPPLETPDPEPEKTPDPEPEPEPAPEPEVPAEEQPGELADVEPWDDYDKNKASEIIDGIRTAEKEYPPSELEELMGHIWVYEEAHKSRAMIFAELEKLAERLSLGEEEPTEPTPEPEPVPEPEAPAEPEVEPEPEVVEDPPVLPGAPTTPEEVEAEAPKEEEPYQPELPLAEGPQDDGPLTDYQKLQQQVEEEVKGERSHIPSPPEEAIPELPWDWTRLSSSELQKFYGIFSALAYHKNYVLAKEERMALHCKAAADELHRDLMVALDKYDEKGKEKKVALIEAEIESDEAVVSWRRRQRKHDIFAAASRQERDSYNKLVESLSRLESMRMNEFERSGGKAGRKG